MKNKSQVLVCECHLTDRFYWLQTDIMSTWSPFSSCIKLISLLVHYSGEKLKLLRDTHIERKDDQYLMKKQENECYVPMQCLRLQLARCLINFNWLGRLWQPTSRVRIAIFAFWQHFYRLLVCFSQSVWFWGFSLVYDIPFPDMATSVKMPKNIRRC